MEIDSSDEEMITKPDTKKSNKKKTKKQPEPAFSFDFDDGQVNKINLITISCTVLIFFHSVTSLVSQT